MSWSIQTAIVTKITILIVMILLIYADVSEAYSNIFSYGTLMAMADGSKVFQGYNSPYNVLSKNCFDKTYDSLSKGILAGELNIGGV